MVIEIRRARSVYGYHTLQVFKTEIRDKSRPPINNDHTLHELSLKSIFFGYKFGGVSVHLGSAIKKQ